MTKYIQETLEIIKEQFNKILDGSFKQWSSEETEEKKAHIAYYKPYVGNVYISSEQQFSRMSEIKPNSIYIVVKFGQSSIDFGQVLLPITIHAVSERNKLDVCQKLLFDFAEYYTQTTHTDVDDFVKEVWYTPSVTANFADINDGYRSLLYMTGNFLIGKNSNPVEYIEYYPNGFSSSVKEVLNPITFSSDFSIQPDTQAFYSTNGLTKSVAKIGTYSFSLSCFLTNITFFNTCLGIQSGNVTSYPLGISTRFYFKIKYKKISTPVEVDALLNNFTLQQNKGDLPTVGITFMR